MPKMPKCTFEVLSVNNILRTCRIVSMGIDFSLFYNTTYDIWTVVFHYRTPCLLEVNEAHGMLQLSWFIFYKFLRTLRLRM